MSYILIRRFWSDATRDAILTIHERLPVSGTINFLNRPFPRVVWANILDKETEMVWMSRPNLNLFLGVFPS